MVTGEKADMKKWNVIYAKIGVEGLKEECVEAPTYTTAIVAFELKHTEDECIESISLIGDRI